MENTSRTLLHLLAQQLQWPYDRFRRAYEEAAVQLAKAEGDPQIARATLSEQTYRRWTGGKVRSLPRSPASMILEHMFSRPVAELLAPPGDEEPESTALRPRTPQIDERELQMTAREAAGHAGEAAARALPDLTLDQAEDDTRALARDYPRTPSGESYRRGLDLLRLAQAMLEQTQRPRQRDRLYLQAGSTAAIMASAAFDLGSLSSAVSLARTAALYGEVIDHHPLRAYAHGALAYLAYWDSRPSDAVRLAQTAGTFTDVGDTGRIRLATIAARAHAHMGDRSAARTAMSQVEQYTTGRRDELHDAVGGEFAMSAARVAMSNATSCLLIQDVARAESAAEEALELVQGHPAEERMSWGSKAAVDLARARLLRRELDGASEAVSPVFDIPSEWRTLGLRERLADLRRDLTAVDVREATVALDLGGQIEAFTITGAGARSHHALEV